MSDEQQPYQEPDTRILVKRNSFCRKSPTGKHKWEVYHGQWICKYCDYMTSEDVLVG